MTNTQSTAYFAAIDADKAFQDAVIAQFGSRNAGTMRYYPKAHNIETYAAGERYRAAAANLRAINESLRVGVSNG